MLDREALDRTLSALADPTRRGVIDLLRKKPRTASDLADALETTRPAMSRHLRILRKGGLVRQEGDDDDARLRIYRLERAPFDDLEGWLEEVHGFWKNQLSAFKAYAEKGGRRDPR
ncbi:MAG TPA: metalloregulator ArsR/SmtB family transcription factor [Labilithrix sp.]|nr:metalloregulator ArsR/SmtB family transcription factor [Labilithrix sp.]